MAISVGDHTNTQIHAHTQTHPYTSIMCEEKCRVASSWSGLTCVGSLNQRYLENDEVEKEPAWRGGGGGNKNDILIVECPYNSIVVEINENSNNLMTHKQNSYKHIHILRCALSFSSLLTSSFPYSLSTHSQTWKGRWMHTKYSSGSSLKRSRRSRKTKGQYSFTLYLLGSRWLQAGQKKNESADYIHREICVENAHTSTHILSLTHIYIYIYIIYYIPHHTHKYTLSHSHSQTQSLSFFLSLSLLWICISLKHGAWHTCCSLCFVR